MTPTGLGAAGDVHSLNCFNRTLLYEVGHVLLLELFVFGQVLGFKLDFPIRLKGVLGSRFPLVVELVRTVSSLVPVSTRCVEWLTGLGTRSGLCLDMRLLTAFQCQVRIC